MFKTIKESLSRWDEQTSDRQKLQHTYIVLAVALVLVAGVLGLLNQAFGQQVLAVAIACAAVFLTNAVAWALLQSFVLLRVAIQPKAVVPAKPAKTTRATKAKAATPRKRKK